jgi:hypothetical protein
MFVLCICIPEFQKRQERLRILEKNRTLFMAVSFFYKISSMLNEDIKWNYVASDTHLISNSAQK